MTDTEQTARHPSLIGFAERPFRLEPGTSTPDSDIYQTTPEERAKTIQSAIEAGITFFHAAYEREAASLGASLKTLGVCDSVTLSTTDGDALERCPDTEEGAAQAIHAAIQRKLTLLGVDRIDVFCLYDFRRDVHTPARLAGARQALTEAQESGQIKEIGATCYEDFDTLAAALETGDFAPSIVAARYNYPDQRASARLFPACQRQGIRALAAQPFAWYGGVPFVRFPNTWRYRNLTKNFYGFTAGQAHLHWLLRSGAVDGILVSMQTSEQVIENTSATRIETAPTGLESLFVSFQEAITANKAGWRELLQDEQWEYREAAAAYLKKRR